MEVCMPRKRLHPAGPHHRMPSGSQHPLSKLTEADIPTIFARYHAGENSYQLAEAYGLTSGTILGVLHRKTWGHVPVPDKLLTLPAKPVPYRDLPLEEPRAYQRAWYHAHRPERLASARDYKATHGDTIRAQQRQHKKAWAAAHPDIIQARNRANLVKNPGAKRRAQARRRMRLDSSAINDLTTEQWQEILAVYGRRCAYCGRKVKNLEQDHILALARGGSHTASNVVPACRSCNAKKHDGPPPAPVQPLLLTIAPPKPRGTK